MSSSAPICRWIQTLLLALAFASAVTLPVAADPTEDDADANALDADFAAGMKAIDRKDWDGAITNLARAQLRDTKNADIENYLGFAYRKIGKYKLAFWHYGKALTLNPRHRGAHEYIGEAYLLVGNLPKALEHLTALRKICVLPCEELGDLEAEIATYRKKMRGK